LIKISKGLAQKDLKKVLKRDKSHIKELENHIAEGHKVLAEKKKVFSALLGPDDKKTDISSSEKLLAQKQLEEKEQKDL
jgi:hypothetical protein